jgi:hypothetical protein
MDGLEWSQFCAICDFCKRELLTILSSVSDGLIRRGDGRMESC